MVVFFALYVLWVTDRIFASRLVYDNGSITLEDYITTSGSLTIESYIIGPFKIWHVGGMVISFIMAIIITICCCKDVRIPRTKQEIEANHKLRQLHSKFGERFFSFNDSGYRKYIDHILSQRECKKFEDQKNNIPRNSKTTSKWVDKFVAKVGDNSQKVLASNWKSVAESLKTITEEIPRDTYMSTGVKNNTGFQQRPGLENIAKTLNSLSITNFNNLSDEKMYSITTKDE